MDLYGSVEAAMPDGQTTMGCVIARIYLTRPFIIIIVTAERTVAGAPSAEQHDSALPPPI